MAFLRSYCSLLSLCSFIGLCFASHPASARVLMDNCNLMEDMYVITIDNEDQVANEAMAMNMLRSIYKERGRKPSYWGMSTWDHIEAYQQYYDNAYQLTRLAILVDPLEQNISLMIHSDHQKNDLFWETDNLAFIDAKNNAFADFRCSGDWIQLKWSRRDLSNPYELFDSSEGMLSAKMEGFINEASQPDMRLKIARLKIHYPRNGITGAISSAYESTINGRTPHPHNYEYEINQNNSRVLVMNGKNRPGYHPLTQQQVNFDVEKLAMAQDESWSQNTMAPGLPVSMATMRTHLQYVKTMLTNETALYTRSVYSAASLNSLIDEADNYIQQGLESAGLDQDIQFDSALKQFSELSSRLKQNRTLSSNASEGYAHLVGKQRRIDQVTEQVDRMLDKLSKELQDHGIRQKLLKEFQQQHAKINFNLIDDSELLLLEPDLFASGSGTTQPPVPHTQGPQDPLLKINLDKAADTSQISDKNEYLGTCLMTQNREGVFNVATNDSHYGFDAGIEIKLLNTNSWIVELESTRTPWTLPLVNTYGTSYQIPQRDTWCHGPFFGVDHAHGNVRMTVRGVYDPVNNKIYAASMWSVWDKSRVLSWLQSVSTGFAYPGLLFAAGALAPVVGVPAAAMFMVASTGVALALTPWSPPETRFSHVRSVGRSLANMGMGDKFYSGSGMKYYSSFGTMKPKSMID